MFDKHSNKSYTTQSQISQTALMHRSQFEEAVILMGEIIEDMYKEIEFKDNTIFFSSDNLGISHGESLKQMEKVN